MCIVNTKTYERKEERKNEKYKIKENRHLVFIFIEILGLELNQIIYDRIELLHAPFGASQ